MKKIIFVKIKMSIEDSEKIGAENITECVEESRT